MKFIDTDIVEVKVFGDERWFFMEAFRAEEFVAKICAKPFVQNNHSKSSISNANYFVWFATITLFAFLILTFPRF